MTLDMAVLRIAALEAELAEEVKLREDCAHGVISLRNALSLEKQRHAQTAAERESYRALMQEVTRQLARARACECQDGERTEVAA